MSPICGRSSTTTILIVLTFPPLLPCCVRKPFSYATTNEDNMKINESSVHYWYTPVT